MSERVKNKEKEKIISPGIVFIGIEATCLSSAPALQVKLSLTELALAKLAAYSVQPWVGPFLFILNSEYLRFFHYDYCLLELQSERYLSNINRRDLSLSV